MKKDRYKGYYVAGLDEDGFFVDSRHDRARNIREAIDIFESERGADALPCIRYTVENDDTGRGGIYDRKGRLLRACMKRKIKLQ